MHQPTVGIAQEELVGQHPYAGRGLGNLAARLVVGPAIGSNFSVGKEFADPRQTVGIDRYSKH